MMQRTMYRSIVAAFLVAAVEPAAAQEADTLRIAVRPDSSVHVFHSIQLPPSYGFNIYRRVGNGEERKLNESPVKGAAYGAEFKAMVGDLFRVLQAAFRESSAPEILTSLRSRPVDARLYTFAYPEIARALGRVYVDSPAPLGSRVTYRIAVTDPFENETGESYRKTAVLTPHAVQAPRALQYSNQGELITLRWKYAVPASGRDDYVIRFDVFRRDSSGAEEKINTEVVLRNEASEDQTFSFRVGDTGIALDVVVRAVDVTGRVGPASPLLKISVRDNVAPSPPVNAGAVVHDDGSVQITWPVSVESDAVGYHVYRASRVDEEAPLTKLTRSPLGLLQTVYRDTTVPVGRGTWAYRVTALDKSGNESKPSNAAMAIVEDRSAPPAPSDLAAEFQRDRTVRLRWRTSALPRDFQTFIIMRRAQVRGVPDIATRINVEDVPQSAFIDPGPASEGFQEGVTYRYWVSASDSTRNVSDSVWVDITIPRVTPPSPPPGFTAQNDRGIRVVLRWSVPEDGIASYTVYRVRTGTRDTTKTQIPGDQQQLRDESVLKATSYMYWVTAVDSAGNQSGPSSKETVFVRQSNPPRSVRNIRAETAQGGILVRWEPVPDSIAGYRVFRSSIATGVYEEVTPSLLTTTQFLDRTGKEGYWYRVHAYDHSGNASALPDPAQAMDTRRRQ